jgi:general secretion pathway protein F
LVGQISIDQLIALTEEMAALVRSGVPLERGLWHLGADMPGSVGRLAQAVAARLERGEPLPQALAGEASNFPPVYQAVVEAGLRTGRLSLALEGMVSSARRLSELRRTISLALFYPLVVVLVAHGLFVYFVLEVAPVLREGYQGFHVSRNPVLDAIEAMRPSAAVWGPLVPALVIAIAALWWRQTRRALLVQPQRSVRLLGWVPWVGRLLRQSQEAMFAQILALLLEHDVPLPEALRLAAATAGGAETRHAAAQLAEHVERGNVAANLGLVLPPLLTWLVAQPTEQSAVVLAARDVANSSFARAAYQGELVRLLLPMGAIALVGGLVTLLYAGTLFVPWTQLLRELQ